MSRINNKDKYSIDTTVTLNDFLIGSDGDALGNIGATKNYPIKSIVRLISEVSGVTLNLFEIVSDPTNSATPEQGEIFTNDDVTEFTDIETIKISKFNSSGVDLTVYLSFIFENKDLFSLQFSRDGNYNVGAYADVSSFVDEGSYYTVNLNIPEENSYGSFSEGDFFSMDISTKITLKSTELSFLAFSVPSRGILGLTATLINLQRPLAPIEKGVIPFINVLVTGEQKIYILAFKDREFNGAYGPNGDITVTESDLQVIGERKLSLDNITDPSTDRIELGDIGNTPVWTFVGALDPSIQVQSETEGYTIFESVKQGIKRAWFYVGETGAVGLNDYQPIEDDFNEISTEPPIEIINIFPKRFYFSSFVSSFGTVEQALASSISNSVSPIRITGSMVPFFSILYGDSKFVLTFNKPVEGVYGSGFQSITSEDLQIVSQFSLNSFTIGDSNTDRIDLEEIGAVEIENVVGALSPSLDIKPLAEGYTVFEALRDGVEHQWLYLGETGLVGQDDYIPEASDFQSLVISDSDTSSSVTFVSSVATDTILGRISAGSGESEELTPTQVRGLINVEDNADVTDTANVTSAGALMDSEVANLSQVKAFDSKDYAVALGLDDNYVTDAEKVVIGNTSGTNTGDQDLSGKVDKVTGSSLISDQAILRLENTSGENTGDQDLSGKVDKVTGESLISDQAITRLANTSGTNTGDQDLSGLEVKRTNRPISESSYILLATDVDKFLIFSNACTVVVPNGLAANLEFQGKQGGTGQVTFSAESGGTLNVPSVFLAETAEQHCFFGIRTDGSDVSTILGTLKLA